MTVEIEFDSELTLPCYRHLRNSTADTNLLWGGRDGAKTREVAQEMIVKCLSLDYFTCLLVRKTFASIKDSQWAVIKEVVEEWGLSQFFIFKVSPLEIQCVNGNKFICRGMDDPAKVKSVNNPSHCWVEEANLLTQEDYDTLSTTLRTNKGRVQEWLSFNPETEEHYEDFWMVKKWPLLKEYRTDSDIIEIKLKDSTITLSYTSTWTTYHDNPYCSSERRAKLENLAATNPFHYDVFTMGKWGRRANDSPAAFAFNREKHIGPTKWNPQEVTIVSCDFNRNPMTWSVFQVINNGEVVGIETFKIPNSGTPAMCQYLKSNYPNALFMITGDSSGNNGTTLTNDHVSNYTLMRKPEHLGLGNGQFRVPKSNPKVKDNLTLMNMVLSQVKCTFDPVRCKHLIYDFENVRVLPTGDLDKSDRQNAMKQADALDTWRYFCNTYFRHLLK